MSIKDQIDSDIKQAMLAGNKTLVTTLRSLKSAILYVEVARGSRDEGLSDIEATEVLSKEAKKRQESADMYVQGNNPERAQAEIDEKLIIEKYLPAQLSDEELKNLVEDVIKEIKIEDNKNMGIIISEVKKRSNGQADGGRIAQIVKDSLK